jgi:hypothetical protein
MKIYLSAIITALLFFSCTESVNEKKETNPEKISTIPLPASLNGCYEMIISNDTASMKIEQNGNVLNGILDYKRKDKDSNKGTVALTISGERAEGYYTFQSEGKTSVRQIVFKVNNSFFAEGYGDIEMKNDTAVFKYPHALNFEDKDAFNKIKCK